MSPSSAAWLGVGFLAGMATWFTQIDAPKSANCSIPMVSRKVVTSYVLKPPPAEIRYEACPQTTAKVAPAKVEEPPVVEEEKPRRRYRHIRRHRRYW